MNSFRIDWCSYQAAQYAVRRWHYSGRLSKARNVFIGVWEHGRFIGTVVFGIGAGNVTNGRRYGLTRTRQMAELTRVALGAHTVPVSRVVSVALRMLKRQSPGIRLVISLADPSQGHVGAIYQAGNWIYTGCTAADVEYFSRGQWVHHRTATSRGSAKGLPSRRLPPKHRYLMPLDAEMRRKIEPLARPYPKRERSSDSGAPVRQAGGGGAHPTRSLGMVHG